MNLNNFTIKSQEAIQKSQEIALSYQNQSIECVHILKGIFHVDENIVPYLLKKMGVNVSLMQQAVDKIITSLPKVVGGKEAPTSVEGLGLARMADAWQLEQITVDRFGEDLCIRGRLPMKK